MVHRAVIAGMQSLSEEFFPYATSSTRRTHRSHDVRFGTVSRESTGSETPVRVQTSGASVSRPVAQTSTKPRKDAQARRGTPDVSSAAPTSRDSERRRHPAGKLGKLQAMTISRLVTGHFGRAGWTSLPTPLFGSHVSLPFTPLPLPYRRCLRPGGVRDQAAHKTPHPRSVIPLR